MFFIIYLLLLFSILFSRSFVNMCFIFIIYSITLGLNLIYYNHLLGGILILLVYTGAILVLFVFIIMLINGMLNLKEYDSYNIYYSIILFVLLLYVVRLVYQPFQAKLSISHVIWVLKIEIPELLYLLNPVYIYLVISLLLYSLLVSTTISSKLSS